MSLTVALLLTSSAFGALEYYYSLDEAAGSTTVTDGIKGAVGTLYNGVQMGATGFWGGAAQFGATYTGDTSDLDKMDHINIPIPDLTAREGTVCFFVKLQDNHYWNYMFGIKDSAAGTDRMQLVHNWRRSGTTPAAYGLGLGDDWDHVPNVRPLSTNRWYHIAATWSDSDGDGAGDYKAYVNGELLASGTYTGLVALDADADIGADGDGHRKGIKGLIDEVYLFSHVLTQADIRLGFPLTFPKPTTLVVTPDSRQVNWQAGETTFDVNNVEEGEMYWTAEVVDGNEWATIISGEWGIDFGTITVSYTTNETGSGRTATVRVTALGAEGSPKNVTVVQAAELTTLSLITPNGGEVLTAGLIYDVNWTSTGSISDVLIEYSTDNGESWADVDTVENTGSYQWDIPVVDSNECLVRVSDLYDANVSDTSDDVFTIFQCLEPIPGDSNGDCYVDFRDFAILAEHWLECGNPFDPDCGVE